MTRAFLRVLVWTIGVSGSQLALAQSSQSIDGPFETRLDMNGDGNLDRAVLVLDPEVGLASLAIFMAAGAAELDPSRKPTFLKKDLPIAGIVSLEGNENGSLAITYGCGGCSNDFETTLTIIYRGNEFLVAGYAFDWDTRDGAGSCDINYLTGKGTLTQGVDGEAVAIKGEFKPEKLADWSDEKRPAACHS